ncbi:MAG: pantoate--beta-alanine ligase [Bacteroidetes bacterium]|nr:pantoate--beta-alanine ligase [Bacteroidota bacterium]
MQVFNTAARLADFIKQLKTENTAVKIGFVPTMGALHEGHMKLIKQAKANADVVLASIFVNPTQFNDPKDLERYPRTPQADLDLLKQHGCDGVFMPAVADIYPNGTAENYVLDFQGLDRVMEGAFRPGHFNGVAQVVERFFRIVNPDLAFFGRKDFQQVAIIKHLVRVKHLPVEIVVVDTARSVDGLALSSRNTLLSADQKKDALIIFKTLSKAVELARTEKDAKKVKEQLISFFNTGSLRLEYLEIADDSTLQPVDTLKAGCTCCIAAFCGTVRLIDNMPLNG